MEVGCYFLHLAPLFVWTTETWYMSDCNIWWLYGANEKRKGKYMSCSWCKSWQKVVEDFYLMQNHQGLRLWSFFYKISSTVWFCMQSCVWYIEWDWIGPDKLS